MPSGVVPLLIAVAAVTLTAPSPAEAATVVADGTALTVVDPAGQADDLRIGVMDDGTTLTVAGSTAQAGVGCRQEAGRVLCAAPYAISFDVDLGAGDDRLVLDTSRLREESPETRIVGGEGADTIEAHGFVLGGPGNDVLRVNQPSDEGDELDGEAGDDELFAGRKAATLVGGPGTDVLHGGPGDDSLVDTTDRGSRDTIRCGGGHNQIERDVGDRLVGCSHGQVSVLSLIRHFWNVWPGGFTVPVTLHLTPLPGTAKLDEATQDVGSWTVACRGRACHKARFDAKGIGSGGRPKIRFRLRSGGVRVPRKGTRSVLPGAKIIITYRAEVGGYSFVKEVTFTTRARKVPRLTRRCFTARINYPQIGGAEGVVETGDGRRHRAACKNVPR